MVKGPTGRAEHGAGSVLVLSGVLVVLMLLLGITSVAAGQHARYRAATAADLAALAAAERLSAGAAAACEAARRIATANETRLRSCSADGWQVDVSVAARPAGPTRWLGDLVRRSRAGATPPRYVAARIGGFQFPLHGAYRISARFGDTGPLWSSNRHTGLDFAAAAGTPVVAAASGRVVQAGFAGRYGNVVMIEHGSVVTVYAHLSRIAVSDGDTVAAGQPVGAVGATGNATGPHLHFEVRVGGVATDPTSFLSG